LILIASFRFVKINLSFFPKGRSIKGVRSQHLTIGNSTPDIPQRGDVVWITLNPQAGHEEAGRRPAVILSPHAYNAKVGLALLYPIVSQAKGYPFEVAIPAGFPVSGVILSDQIKSLDWRARKAEWVCTFLDQNPVYSLLFSPFWGQGKALASNGIS